MATKDTEKKSVTGLDHAENRKEAEFDLVTNLLKAADFKSSDESITPVDIKRYGEFLFTVHIHPVSDSEVAAARKKATTYMPNPNGKKLPPIEKEFSTSKFTSWLIYLATTEEDQQKIWGNQQLMQTHGLMQPWESIDVLLTFGEKQKLNETVYKISGMNEDELNDEEEVDVETFQS